jgi:tRNA(adenine34) deaminase
MTGVDDLHFMRCAFELASQAATAGNAPIGAVLVIGDLVFEAKNERELLNDVTMHPELRLISQASRRLGTWLLSHATLYVTREPCIMCAGAIIASRVKRLVYCIPDPINGANGGAFNLLSSPKVPYHPEITVLRNSGSFQIPE